MNLAGFDVFRIDAGIADMRIGQRDDLTAVTGVSENFLVTGHRGIEYHFANRMTGSTNGKTLEQRAICERKNGGNSIAVEKWQQG